MTFDQAMNEATINAKTVMLPHWHWVGVRNVKGKYRIVDEYDTAGDIYKPSRSDKRSTLWMIRE